MNTNKKVGLGIYISLLFGTLLVFADIKEYDLNIFSIGLIFGISVYSGFGVLAGWSLFGTKVESKISKLLLPAYIVLKFYLSIYIGLIYLPFWAFKRLKYKP